MDTATETQTSQFVAVQALTAFGKGRVRDAVQGFAERFSFEDRGIGFRCSEKNRLVEFFDKATELYPNSVLEIGPIVANGDDTALEWTVRTFVAELYPGNLTRRVPVAINGVSIVRTENGKVTRRFDYYDGLGARRTALSSYFTEWVEL